jgi:Zn-dependent protease
MFGSVILPAFLILSKAGFLFGWAKPVPYNPDNLSDKKWGTVAVAGAGILANLFVALIFGLLIRFSYLFPLPSSFYFMTSSIVAINLALAIFNLVPIPPLDGSKILFSLLPKSALPFIILLEQHAFILLIVFIVFFSDHLYPVMAFLYQLLTGIPP